QSVLKMAVHFVRRYNKRRTRVLWVVRDGVVQVDQIYFEPFHHCHSFDSKSPAGCSTSSRSSSDSAERENAASQSLRGFEILRIRIPSSTATRSTSPETAASSSKTLGIRIPCEFPICIIRAF